MNPSQSFAWFLFHHLAFENEECPFPILKHPVFWWCSRTKASHLWKLSNSEISSSAHLYSSTTSAPIFRPKKCHFGWSFFWDHFGPPSSRQRNCRRTSFEEVKWRTEASAHRVCHLQSCPWFSQMRPPGRSSESTKKWNSNFTRLASSVLAYLRIIFVDNRIAEYDVSEGHLASLQSFCSFSEPNVHRNDQVEEVTNRYEIAKICSQEVALWQNE